MDLYNRPGEDRRLEAFIVHMQIAWLYLAHARFGRDGVDYRYWNASGRLIRGSDGEFRTWELAQCLKKVFPAPNDPVRRNVEFFVSLRNRIEHRYERLLDPVVAGKCQSLIMNYEAALTGWFGVDEGLASPLRFPVFLSTLADDAVEALRQTYKRLPKRITTYLEDRDASLPDEVTSDHRYDFRVLLIPVAGPKSEADAAMRFVRADDLTAEGHEAFDRVQTIVRDKRVPVSGKGKLRVSQVCKRVEEALGIRLSPSSHHARAWKHYGVRPPPPPPPPRGSAARTHQTAVLRLRRTPR